MNSDIIYGSVLMSIIFSNIFNYKATKKFKTASVFFFYQCSTIKNIIKAYI